MTESETPGRLDLDGFNAIASADARDLLGRCLAVPRWAEEVSAGRPYRDLAALHNQARASAANLSDSELAAALAAHPRIGEREPVPSSADGDSSDTATASFSSAEQSGVASDDADLAARLRAGNERYEQRFGRVFIIRAADRDGPEILAELERRLDNDEVAERRETVDQLRDIALRRLDQVVGP
jgi:2-oxo-4-hydroxy-4-carboxy-5-ureidoimidazoline decarboxylase